MCTSLIRMFAYTGDRPPKGAVNPISWLDKKLDVFAQPEGTVYAHDAGVATSVPLGPMRVAGASPQHLDVLMLFFREEGTEDRAEIEGLQEKVAEDKGTSACSPLKRAFVPVRLTIVARYPPLETAQDEMAPEAGLSMAGVLGELVDLKIEWWDNGLPNGVKTSASSATGGTADGPDPKLHGGGNGAYAAGIGEDRAIESASGRYDHSWSRSVYLEGLDTAPTYEQSLTSDISPEMLACWGSYKFDRDRSNCDMFEPSL